MIAIDTNILVYAHCPHLEAHARCRTAIADLVRSGTRFALPWPCLHEFIGVVTNARVLSPPTSVAEALVLMSPPQHALSGLARTRCPARRRVLWR